MVRKHLRFALSVRIVLGADGVAGDGILLDHVRLAVGAFADDEVGDVGHRGRTEEKSYETCHCQSDSIHNTLFFLPGMDALAVWG